MNNELDKKHKAHEETPSLGEARTCPQCCEGRLEQWPDYIGNKMNLFASTTSEVLLGYRALKNCYVCYACKGDVRTRLFTVCESCKTVYDTRLFDGLGMVFCWSGFCCPKCGEHLCVDESWLTKLIFKMTMPIWWLPCVAISPKLKAWNEKRLDQKIKVSGKRAATSVVYSDDGGGEDLSFRNMEYLFGALLGTFIWLFGFYVMRTPVLIDKPLESALVIVFVCLILGRKLAWDFEKSVAESGQLPKDEAKLNMTDSSRDLITSESDNLDT